MYISAFVGEQLAQEIAVSRKCCTENSRKVAAGVLMTVLIALSWVGAAHCLKVGFKLAAANHFAYRCFSHCCRESFMNRVLMMPRDWAFCGR